MVEKIVAHERLTYYIRDNSEIYVLYNEKPYTIRLAWFDRRDIKGLRKIMEDIRKGKAGDIFELHTIMKPRFCLKHTTETDIFNV